MPEIIVKHEGVFYTSRGAADYTQHGPGLLARLFLSPHGLAEAIAVDSGAVAGSALTPPARRLPAQNNAEA
jgi:hypothetical protein